MNVQAPNSYGRRNGSKRTRKDELVTSYTHASHKGGFESLDRRQSVDANTFYPPPESCEYLLRDNLTIQL